MNVRIGRTLPPAAAPIPFTTLLRALPACFRSTGRGTQNLEKEVQDAFAVKHCFLLSSGKAALTLILQGLQELYPERNEVVIPAFTCYSVPASAKRAGLQIRLCDMAPSSLDFDRTKLREIVTADRGAKKILCVLVTHLFGCPADLAAIRRITGNDIPIVEDAAQAMGEEMDGVKLGMTSDAGIYSLGRGKALSTVEGGVIVTSRDDLAGKLAALTASLPPYSTSAAVKLGVKALLTNILQKPILFWLPRALPFLRLGETIYESDFSVRKISAFQRELARNWHARLEAHRRARVAALNFWKRNLPADYRLVCSEKNRSMIRLPVFAQSEEQRDKVCDQSEGRGLGIMPSYPTPVNEIPELREEFFDQRYPQARDICDRLFTLPAHEFVRAKDRENIRCLLRGQDAGRGFSEKKREQYSPSPDE